jgi:hypothetical protein
MFRVIEVLLVHDNGPDDSAAVIRELANSKPTVRPVAADQQRWRRPSDREAAPDPVGVQRVDDSDAAGVGGDLALFDEMVAGVLCRRARQ